jgi:hypothetical protein
MKKLRFDHVLINDVIKNPDSSKHSVITKIRVFSDTKNVKLFFYNTNAF